MEPIYGGCYDIAKRQVNELLLTYQSFCRQRGFECDYHPSPLSPDDSTLFATSGMQKRKSSFADPSLRGVTVCDIQACLRANDLDEIGDGSHALLFRMLGLFSFRDLPLVEGMRFWLDFLKEIGVEPDAITLHPDKREEWGPLWESLGQGGKLQLDEGCLWSDGAIGGYCTELYVGGVEVGNIVNPLGDCLDCGFGLERLALVSGRLSPPTESETLIECLESLRDHGVRPGPKGGGYVMRKLLSRLLKSGVAWEDPLFESERLRRERCLGLYQRLLPRNRDKSDAWWRETHGVDPSSL